MSAYTLDQLRAAAPAQFRELDDESLVREYARTKQVPFEQAADYYGVKPRGTLGEMRRQAAGGAVVDLPRMVGQGLKATGIAPTFGQELVEGSEGRAYQYDMDRRPERGLVGQALTLGARGLAPTVPIVASAFLPGGQVVAPAMAAGLFGTSSYQETYEKVLAQTGDEAAARAAAIRVGALQGGGEGVATAAFGALARPVLGAVRGRPTTAGVAQAATDTSIVRPLVRGQAINIPTQAGTEALQDVGTEMIERSYGTTPEDIGEIAKESALGGAGLALLLGLPLGVGGSVSRSRSAERLQQALYDPQATPEVREAARQQVMEAARRQGVSPQDAEEWLQRQLREEAANIADVQQKEEETLDALTETPYADIAYALRDPELSAAMSEPDRTTLFSSLETLQAADTPTEQRDALLADANEIIGRYAAALQGPEAETDLTQPFGLQRQSALTSPQPIQELNLAGGLTQVQTNIPDSLAGYQAPAPAGREMARAQIPAPVEGVEGIEAVRPGVFQVAQPLQQVGTFVGPRAPAAPVTPVGAPTAVAAALPAAQPAAGVSSTATTGAPSGTQASQAVKTKTQKQKAPVAAGSVVKVNDTEVTLDKEQADAWNAAQEAYDGKVRRAKAITNYQDRDSALRSAGMQLSAERRKITGALTVKEQEAAGPKNVSEAIKEDNEIDRVLKAIEAEDDAGGDKLFAGVTGQAKKAPGRPSMPTQVYAAIRNAILNPKGAVMVRKAKSVEKDVALTEKFGDKVKRIAAAAKAFADAYETYSSQNLVRSGETIKRDTTADAAVSNRAEVLQANARAVQSTLAKLGEAVDGNAKDVEAIVRFVKDRAQKEKRSDQKVVQNDILLSRAWAAAKRETFISEPDLLDVSPTEVRQSRESTAKGAVPQLVEAATEGYQIMGKGEAQTGLNGILNYIRTVGTPFEKTLAQAIKLAVKGKAPIKIEFVKEGLSKYDPKTNTITINETSSKEVALHEALHGALQWFVYTNPNLPQVTALKAALQRVVNFDTTKLTPKAAEVQAVLKKTLAGKSKTAELDAVLELVSYGNTLNDFRRALQGVESNAPRTFVKFANDVMEAINALVRRMLGVKQSVASDVIENTIQLLESARQATQETAPKKGNVLQAAVQSTDPTTAPTIDAAAQQVGFADATAFANGPGKFKTPTQIVFEIVGLGRVNGKDLPLTASIAKNGAKLANYIRKEVPTLERMIMQFNSNFSNSPATVAAINNYKFLAQTGHLQMEKIATTIAARPALREPFLDYMDGNTKAFDGVKGASGFKAIADNLKGLMQQYISTLPANSKERRAFESMPFTQYIISPTSISQVAGSTLSAGKIASMVGTQTQKHQSLDEFKQFLDMTDGIVDQDQPLYQMFEEKLGKTLPVGFISKAQYDKTGVTPAGFSVDAKRVWKFSKYDTDKSNFEFSSSITTRDALKNLKNEDLALALVNTTAALSHAHAATTYFGNLASIGREGGKPTAEAVAFNNVDEINEVFGDRNLELNNVLQVSDEASKSQSLRWQTQRTGTWVQLPQGTTYGALAGKIIPGPVWNAMIDMHDRSPSINFKSFNEMMSFFKQSKTILNPGTHVTNILSNVALLILHDIRLGTMSRAARMYANFERNPDAMTPADRELMQAFFNSGAVLGQFTNSELKGSIYDRLSESITPVSDQSYITRMTSMTKFEKAKSKLKGWRDNAAEVYAAEDNVFRFAAFLETAGNVQLRDGTQRLNAKQLEEVGLAARKMFLDYDIDARAIRALRQTFLPFVSWPYAIMPVLGRIAVTKPWTIVNMMASVMLMQAALGGEEDDELRKQGPDYLRERSLFGLGPYMHMRVPFVGDDQNPTYFNLGKYIPFLTLPQPAPGESPFAGQSWLPGFATPGGPLVSLISAMNGYDPFTGKPMHAPTDTEWDKLVTTGKAAYDTMAPPVVGTKFWDQIGQLKDGATGPTGIEKSSMFLVRTLGGLGLYQFNTEEAAFYKSKEFKEIKKDFKAAMTKAKREEYRKGYPDYEALDRELDDLRDRMQEALAKARGED